MHSASSITLRMGPFPSEDVPQLIERCKRIMHLLDCPSTRIIAKHEMEQDRVIAIMGERRKTPYTVDDFERAVEAARPEAAGVYVTVFHRDSELGNEHWYWRPELSPDFDSMIYRKTSLIAKGEGVVSDAQREAIKSGHLKTGIHDLERYFRFPALHHPLYQRDLLRLRMLHQASVIDINEAQLVQTRNRLLLSHESLADHAGTLGVSPASLSLEI